MGTADPTPDLVALLRRLAQAGEPLSIRLRHAGMEVVLSVLPPDQENADDLPADDLPAAGSPPDDLPADEGYWSFFLSPLERGIVKVLARKPRLRAKEIGTETEHVDRTGQADPHLRSILPNLVERGIIVDPGDGYRLTEEGLAIARKLGLASSS